MNLKKQATSLAVMHAADVVQPLILLPYAASVLGPAAFGQYAYAFALAQFANTFVDYGFYWTAQRTAASSRDQPGPLSRLLAEVTATKALLWIVAVLAGLGSISSGLRLGLPLFLCAMLSPLGNVLFAGWLLVAIERAWQAALAVVVARALALGLFILLIRAPGDVELAVAIQASVTILAGIVGLPFILSIGLSGFKTVRLSSIRAQLHIGLAGFVATLSRSAASNFPVPMVEHISGYVAAGQFAVADKFIGATRPVFRVLSETLMPRVAFYARHEPEKGLQLIWRSLWFVSLGASLSIGVYFSAPLVIALLFGSQYAEASDIIQTLSIVPLLINMNIVTSNLYMFHYAPERHWMAVTLLGFFALVVISFSASRFLPGTVAVALGIIGGELIVLAVSSFFFVQASFRAPKPVPAGAGEPV